jgi:hypothetical protein
MEIEALKEAIAKAGGQTNLGKLIGVSQGHVSQWLRRGRVPATRAISIEKATGVSRKDLRPDVFSDS